MRSVMSQIATPLPPTPVGLAENGAAYFRYVLFAVIALLGLAVTSRKEREK